MQPVLSGTWTVTRAAWLAPSSSADLRALGGLIYPSAALAAHRHTANGRSCKSGRNHTGLVFFSSPNSTKSPQNLCRTPSPYSYLEKRCQRFEVLFCTCYRNVLFLLAEIAHNPKTTDDHCGRPLGVLMAELWGRFGIPTLQGAAFPPPCFAPQ